MTKEEVMLKGLCRGVCSAPRFNRGGDFCGDAQNQSVKRRDPCARQSHAAVWTDPAIHHLARAGIAIHLGLHHLANGDVGLRQELAVVLAHDAANAGTSIGAEWQQRSCIWAAVGSEPQRSTSEDWNISIVLRTQRFSRCVKSFKRGLRNHAFQNLR